MQYYIELITSQKHFFREFGIWLEMKKECEKKEMEMKNTLLQHHTIQKFNSQLVTNLTNALLQGTCNHITDETV